MVAMAMAGATACSSSQLLRHERVPRMPVQIVQRSIGFPQLGALLQSRRKCIRCIVQDSPAELQPISSEEEFEELLGEAERTGTTLVIEWMARWCRKCIYLKPQLEKLAMEFKQQGVKFHFVDVNAVPQTLVKRAGVAKMPTIQLWKDRKIIGEIVAGQKVWLVVGEVRNLLQNQNR